MKDFGSVDKRGVYSIGVAIAARSTCTTFGDSNFRSCLGCSFGQSSQDGAISRD